MKDSFVRVAAATPEIKVADPMYNADLIIKLIKEASFNQAAAIVFPELSLTGYTCGDLFLNRTLLSKAQSALLKIMEETEFCDILCAVGMPVPYMGKLYDAVAVFKNGDLLALPVKKNIENYGEHDDLRYFTPFEGTEIISFCGFEVPMGENIVLSCASQSDFTIGFEIGSDVFAPCPPSVNLSKMGASIILNSSCTGETVGKASFRRNLIKTYSEKIISGYVFCDAGFGESTTDLVFAGHRIIAENGNILAEGELFTNGITYSDIDLERIAHERRRMNTYVQDVGDNLNNVLFDYEEESFDGFELIRHIPQMPFIPENEAELNERCSEILTLQSFGLVKRLKHINAKTAVIALSGGLDSTLALLVTVKAFDTLGLDRKGILTYSMPCFGTTQRTKSNAQTLAEALGVSFKEISIKDSVSQHFKDIGQDPQKLDVTFENSQARERTQVIMDIANMVGGIVIGTGDLSELALGWATYNGDHMSMYSVNASIPKTLVRHLVRYCANTQEDIKAVLLDILDTPVSPELLPPKDGEISQKTEDLVGPYELHDFFMFYLVRYGFSPKKIYNMALKAFEGTYDSETIKKWLRTFFRRFFTQQFKRSCLPDGPKVGSVGFSPRGDFKMPSDASYNIWMQEIDEIE